MDRARISHLAHAAHPIAAPLSDGAVEAVLRTVVGGARTMLDLGCGDGTWLLRALRLDRSLTAVGVDISDLGFDRVLEQARADGTADRLALVHADVGTWVSHERFDVVLCVGATHGFGGLPQTLDAMDRHAWPDGVLVVGEGIWDVPPTPAALAALDATPEEFGDLAALARLVEARGWVPLHGHISTREEWDDYEWSWTGSLVRWARSHHEDPDAEVVLAAAEAHRRRWLDGYRGVLGFATLVLCRAGGDGTGSTGHRQIVTTSTS